MENTTTPAAVTPASVAIRYGLLIGIVTVIYSLVLMATGLEQKPVLGFVTFGILIVGIVLAHKYFKQNHGGFMSYGQGLGIATIMGAVIGTLSSVFRYIYVNFVDAEYTQRAIETARAKLEADGMSDEQVEQAMSFTSKMMATGPLSIVFGILASAFFAFLLALVISAFTKNARPEFE
ncbi:DUF4199 domain-containing protein [Hymenobacter rubripertinctus]|uniref:DUF4199 domain-containing protein n=1 Tax=Hymenobacter rubripertinctus TaxID=2029981 RepID=A0A418QID5_9BACT|nr:DUF4199 domain-containing protein [Hymenobacter rubripertinctus]RIY04931.1 DUF4199 domain-containing protein [Hymenobacter rubripertinctus]